jgi:hypothetical protein
MNKMWKKSMALFAGAAMALTLMSVPSLAQRGEGRKGGGDPQKMMDRHVEHLTKRLELSNDQAATLRPIIEENHKKMMELRKSGERPTREQMETMRTEFNGKLATVLNADQMKKYEEMQKEMRGRMGKRGGGWKDKGEKQPQQQPQQQ